ncbi:MAG: hypothetical protein AABW54_00790 [Candidatus Micrarchaeota archaeon]
MRFARRRVHACHAVHLPKRHESMFKRRKRHDSTRVRMLMLAISAHAARQREAERLRLLMAAVAGFRK